MSRPPNSEPDLPRIAISPWLWGVTIAALLFFGYTLWQAQKLQSELNELQLQMRAEKSQKESLESQRREMDQIRALLAAPGTRAWLLESASAEMPPLKVFWNEELGLLATSQAPLAIPSGRVLQLWMVSKDGKSASLGTIQPPPTGNLLKLLPPVAAIRMSNAAALTATIEPARGSAQPSSEPAWTGRIR